jgi:hypothetical protein
MNNGKSPKEHQREYRRLAEQVREAAHKVLTEQERAELLARAKLWDFLADHCPDRPNLHPSLRD